MQAARPALGQFNSPLGIASGAFAFQPLVPLTAEQLELQKEERRMEEKKRMLAELEALSKVKETLLDKKETLQTFKMANPYAANGGTKRPRKPTAAAAAMSSELLSGDSGGEMYAYGGGGARTEPRARRPAQREFGALRGGVATPPPSYGGTAASKKRPAAVALPPPKGPREAKRRKVESERAKRMAGLFKQCTGLLKACLAQSWGWLFAEPVDPVKLGLPDYFHVIKQPMDFRTIGEKLSNGVYTWPNQFKADMELVFRNCTAYNPPGDSVHTAGVAGAAFFAQQWEQSSLEYREHDELVVRHNEDVAVEALPEEGPIPQELLGGGGGGAAAARPRDREAEKQRRQEAKAREQPAAGGGAATGRGQRAAKKKKRAADSDDTDVSSLGDDDEEEDDAPRPAARPRAPAPRKPAPVARPAAGGRSAPGGGGGAAKPITAPPPPPPRPAMKFEQKRQLSIALQSLPVQKQARVVQIISESQLTKTNDDEIEIDLDQMDNTTLWRLFDFVFPRSKQIDMGIPEIYKAEPVVAPPPPPAAANGDDTSSSDDSSDSDSEDAQPAVPGATPSAAAAAAAAQAKSEGGESAPAPAAAPAPAGDVSVLDASATGHAGGAPPILKDGPHAKKEGAILQNASSWANFVNAPAGDAAAQPPAPAAVTPSAAAGPVVPDALWSEFEAKEAEKQRAEEMRKAAAEASRLEHERKLASEQAAREAAAAAAAAQEEQARAAAAKAEADKVAEREAARERARAQLAGVGQTVDLDADRTIMHEMSTGGFDMPMEEPPGGGAVQ